MVKAFCFAVVAGVFITVVGWAQPALPSDLTSNTDVMEGFLRYQAAVNGEVIQRNAIEAGRGDVLMGAMARQFGVSPAEAGIIQATAAQVVQKLEALRSEAQQYAARLTASNQPITRAAFQGYDDTRVTLIQSAISQIRSALSPESWPAFVGYLSTEYASGISQRKVPSANTK